VAHRWDAATYHRLADWQEREGIAVLDRLALRGDETVMDAGCGTGRVTRHLVERLPRGRVIGVDASAEMLAEARRNLPSDRVQLVLADLTEVELDTPVDAIVSSAVFHWVIDQDALFARLHDAVRPGGHLAAWLGGEGTHDELYSRAAEVGREEPFAARFDGWSPPFVFPGVDETAARLERAGFIDITCSMRPFRHDHDSVEYFRTCSLSAHVQRLPEDLRDDYLARVLETQSRPYGSTMQVLSIDARRP